METANEVFRKFVDRILQRKITSSDEMKKILVSSNEVREKLMFDYLYDEIYNVKKNLMFTHTFFLKHKTTYLGK